MWTDTMNLSDRPTYRPISPDLAAHYVARGRELRAQAIAGAIRRLLGRTEAAPPLQETRLPETRLPETRLPETRPQDGVSAMAGDLRPSLTAIRASAEALRDNPDIDSTKRRRYLDVVLIEEARLQVLASRLLAAAKAAPGEADRAKLEPAPGRCG